MCEWARTSYSLEQKISHRFKENEGITHIAHMCTPASNDRVRTARLSMIHLLRSIQMLFFCFQYSFGQDDWTKMKNTNCTHGDVTFSTHLNEIILRHDDQTVSYGMQNDTKWMGHPSTKRFKELCCACQFVRALCCSCWSQLLLHRTQFMGANDRK